MMPGRPGPLDHQPVPHGVGGASRSPGPTVLPVIGRGEPGSLVYAWSKSGPGDSQVSSDLVECPRGQVAIAVPGDDRPPPVGGV